MPKMELVLSDTFFAIHGVARVYSSLGDWKDIFVTQLVIIIKPEASTFPMIVIFFRGCVCEVVIPSHSVTCYIYIPVTLGLCFHYRCAVYGVCIWTGTWWPAGRVRVFAHYIISLSSLCRLVWRHWSFKVFVRYMMPSVCLRLSQTRSIILYTM